MATGKKSNSGKKTATNSTRKAARPATKKIKKQPAAPVAAAPVELNDNQKLFLSFFRKNGNISKAARDANIDRRTHYDWLESEGYKKAFEDAREEAADYLEEEAWRRAVEGVDEPVWYQGMEVGAVRRYSDTLLIVLLKARRPKDFKENVLFSDDRLNALIEAELEKARVNAGNS